MKLKNKTLRWYQEESALAALKSIEKADSNPICAMPTGSGKTLVVCGIIIEYLKKNPDKNILVVSHVKEILKQNYEELESELDEKIGLFSSGLNRKDIEKVTVIGIQTARNCPEKFKNVGLIIIDECHLVSEWNEGTYRKFLSKFDCNCIGLTATPFRSSGYVHLSEEALFTEICYDLNSYENFNRLVDEGYLSKIYSKPTDLKMQLPKGVGTIGGDWNNNDLDILFNNEKITNKVLDEAKIIIEKGNYKKILIFCINIKHSERVSEKLNKMGISCDFIHSKMEKDRDEVLNSFRKGEIRSLSNVDVLTTGLDIRNIDMIISLRNTKSLSLYVQIIGRGLRTHPDKDHCLFLDFADNIINLGPINDLKIDQRGKPQKGGEAPVKECPECKTHNHPIAKECIRCGYKFKFKTKITKTYSDLNILKEEKPQELKVVNTFYSRHKKKGSNDSFKISYQVGLRKFEKWLAVESYNQNAANWAKSEIPGMIKKGEKINGYFTVDNLLRQKQKFKTPLKILVDLNEKYPRIKKIFYKEDNL